MPTRPSQGKARATNGRSAPPSRSPSRSPRKSRAAKPLPDRHVLYQQAVQAPESEMDFVQSVFRRLRGRRPARLREDFCGTAHSACEWVRRREENTAVGLDLDRATLDWGLKHNVAGLEPEARKRVRLLRRNVLKPGPGADNMDVVLAMNFSWWVFQTRATLLDYFRAVHRSLAGDGIFILDIYGGWESMKEQREKRQIGGKKRGFTYIWDQERIDPINNRTRCHIHFRLKGGRTIRKAYTYDWRIWTIPEARDALADAGFSRTTVYWEGDNGRGGGNGIFSPRKTGECCHTFVSYILAEP